MVVGVACIHALFNLSSSHLGGHPLRVHLQLLLAEIVLLHTCNGVTIQVGPAAGQIAPVRIAQAGSDLPKFLVAEVTELVCVLVGPLDAPHAMV